MFVTIVYWALAYLFLGMGFAIAVLFNDKLCPKTGAGLVAAWVFWLPLILGHVYAKVWQNVVNTAAEG